MLFGAEGALAADDIIKEAANQKPGLNIAARPGGKTKFG